MTCTFCGNDSPRIINSSNGATICDKCIVECYELISENPWRGGGEAIDLPTPESFGGGRYLAIVTTDGDGAIDTVEPVEQTRIAIDGYVAAWWTTGNLGRILNPVDNTLTLYWSSRDALESLGYAALRGRQDEMMKMVGGEE
jgi:hypothetical protein